MKIKDSHWLVVVLLLVSVVLLSCSKGSEPPPAPAGSTTSTAPAGPNTPPEGFLDLATYEKGHFRAGGWAADKEDNAPVKKVMVYVDNKILGEAELGIQRGDVATEKKNPNWKNSGWEINKQIPLDKGSHQVYAVAVDKQGAEVKLPNEKNITVK
jgi:hypothetical protein